MLLYPSVGTDLLMLLPDLRSGCSGCRGLYLKALARGDIEPIRMGRTMSWPGLVGGQQHSIQSKKASSLALHTQYATFRLAKAEPLLNGFAQCFLTCVISSSQKRGSPHTGPSA